MLLDPYRDGITVRRLCQDRFGKIARAMRDDERRARAYGCRVCPDTDYVEVLRSRWWPRCYLCNAELVADILSFDHHIPLSAGGDHCNANIMVACWPCNHAKGDRLVIAPEFD